MKTIFIAVLLILGAATYVLAEEENKELIKEIENMENPFDMKVANALANGEVEMTINKNKM